MDEASPTPRITGFMLAVADPERSGRFYVEGLGFRRKAQDAHSVTLDLDGVHVILRAESGALSPPRCADSPNFQHFAIRVSDMAASYAHLAGVDPTPLSHGGPQRLPPDDGSVTAWKFRDPDGHPLELLQPAQAPSPRAPLFQAIDHTALACFDPAASHAFYAGLGFVRGEGSHNQGPAQDRLDNLERADLHIDVVRTPEPGPHIELLHYLNAGAPAYPTAAVPFVITHLAAHEDARLSDPDGHALRLFRSAGTPAGFEV